MNPQISLKELEKTAYRSFNQDGILDIQIGCFLLIFAVAPFLSPYLGDFWSSMIFLPFWALVYFVTRMIKNRLVTPRIGRVEFGSFRKKRLLRLNLVILVFNIIALVLGILSFIQFSEIPGYVHTLRFSILILIGFSLAGYMLEFPRLYIYGVLAAAAPFVGEFLYQNFGISHHGFPVTFGIVSASLIIIGSTILIRIIRKYPVSDEEQLV
jgi:hypothetical protein